MVIVIVLLKQNWKIICWWYSHKPNTHSSNNTPFPPTTGCRPELLPHNRSHFTKFQRPNKWCQSHVELEFEFCCPLVANYFRLRNEVYTQERRERTESPPTIPWRIAKCQEATPPCGSSVFTRGDPVAGLKKGRRRRDLCLW